MGGVPTRIIEFNSCRSKSCLAVMVIDSVYVSRKSKCYLHASTSPFVDVRLMPIGELQLSAEQRMKRQVATIVILLLCPCEGDNRTREH